VSIRFLWSLPLGSIFERMLIYIRICSILPIAAANLGPCTSVVGWRHLIPDSQNYRARMAFCWDFHRLGDFIPALHGPNNTPWMATPQVLLLSLNDHNTYCIR